MLTRLRELLSTGRGAMTLAAGWNVFDAALHLAIGMVEPLRLAGNLVAVAVAVLVRVAPSGRIAALIGAVGMGTTIGLVLGLAGGQGGLLGPAVLLIGVGLVLLAIGTYRFAVAGGPEEPQLRQRIVTGAFSLVLMVGVAVLVLPQSLLSSVRAQAFDDRLVDADYWSDEPEILSAGMGFEGIIGVPSLDEETVREFGGAWIGDPDCAEPPDDGGLTSAATPLQVNLTYRGPVEGGDGLPVVFSWPVLGETAHVEDFRFTTNTGETVFPTTVGMWPNWELSERNTVVAFGEFGNRGRADDDDAVFPVRLEIVDDGTPLTLVGPDGPVSAVGLTWETQTSPYDAGPALVGAKLNHVGEESTGEGGVGLWEGMAFMPNDEFALYDRGDFRLRVLTSGGFSPDGVSPVTPDSYEDHFRIHATGADGGIVLLEEVGVPYEVAGGTLEVIGMADLGRAAGGDVVYDQCYREDRDNYIDLILVGDEGAARSITHVEIPGGDGYVPFYNPGGPGTEPFPEVTYTAPGPRDLEPVTIALDDPMRVSHP